MIPPARRVGRPSGPIRVAIADDVGLIYSDDYRDGWKWGFESLGCTVNTVDVSALRKFHVRTSGPYSGFGGMRGLPKMIAQSILKWRPDMVFAHHGRAASNDMFIDTLKKSGVPTAVYLCDEPYEVGETARYSPKFDYVFTMDYETVFVHEDSRNSRNRVFYLPPGVNTDRYQPFWETNTLERRTIPCLFLGNATLTPRPDWLRPVEQLVNGCDIRFWKTVAKGQKGWVGIEDHPKLFSSCLMGLNVHRSPWMSEQCYKTRVLSRSRHLPLPKGLPLCKTPNHSWGTGFWNDGNIPASHVNPRFFEMSACGALVISDDHRSEMARMFPLAPQAASPGHFVELVQYYISHPREAQALAETCRFLISRQHTYKHRAAEILIRVGLKGLQEDEMYTYLGEPTGWLTHQDSNSLRAKSSLEVTGRSGRWSPRYGTSLIKMSGSVNASDSLDVPTQWSV